MRDKNIDRWIQKDRKRERERESNREEKANDLKHFVSRSALPYNIVQLPICVRAYTNKGDFQNVCSILPSYAPFYSSPPTLLHLPTTYYKLFLSHSLFFCFQNWNIQLAGRSPVATFHTHAHMRTATSSYLKSSRKKFDLALFCFFQAPFIFIYFFSSPYSYSFFFYFFIVFIIVIFYRFIYILLSFLYHDFREKFLYSMLMELVYNDNLNKITNLYDNVQCLLIGRLIVW